MAREQHRHPTEESSRRLAAREFEQREERHDLAVVELAVRPVAPLQVGREQLREQVVLRHPAPLVDELFDVGADAADRFQFFGRDLRVAVVEPHHGVDPLAQHVLVFVGDSQQRADHHRRDLRREHLHVVEAVAVAFGIEELRAQLTGARFERANSARREGPAHDAAQIVMIGRVQEDHHSEPGIGHRRFGIVGGRVDHLEHGAARGAIGLPLERRLQHIGEARQCVEVVALVVVERRFVAHPLPHRVRIRVDLGVVGVVVQRRHAGAVLQLPRFGMQDAVRDTRGQAQIRRPGR